jgi:hypothetical protein
MIDGYECRNSKSPKASRQTVLIDLHIAERLFGGSLFVTPCRECPMLFGRSLLFTIMHNFVISVKMTTTRR